MSLPSDSLSLDTHTDSQLDFSLLSIANESENYSENVVEEFEYASQDIDGILLEIQGITNNNLKWQSMLISRQNKKRKSRQAYEETNANIS